MNKNKYNPNIARRCKDGIPQETFNRTNTTLLDEDYHKNSHHSNVWNDNHERILGSINPHGKLLIHFLTFFSKE